MPNGNFLLDTNIVIALFANDPSVLGQLEVAESVFVPSIVLGELFYGAARSGRPQENIARIELFAAEAAVLDCTEVTARFYGELKDQLRAIGRPIPENDICIAAMAGQHRLVLVTRDGHFDAIEDITTVAWQ